MRFTDAEKQTARALYPFFLRGYRELVSAEVSRSDGLELLLDRQLRVLGSSAGWARRMTKSREHNLKHRIIHQLAHRPPRLSGAPLTFVVEDTTCEARSLAGQLCHVCVRPGARAVRVAADDLTRREREILDWIAQGKRNGEIATILGIAPKTVSKHVEHILAKLHVETRTAAAAFARGER